MKIIILGAGQVGGTLAEHLANEENDITVVDINEERLRELQNRLDIRTVIGTASYPNILRQAGGEDADMLIAVTSSDEINMVACQVAHTLFRTPTKIGRVRSTAYLTRKMMTRTVMAARTSLSSRRSTLTAAATATATALATALTRMMTATACRI